MNDEDDRRWLGDELREMRRRAAAEGRWRDVAVASAVYDCGVLAAPPASEAAAPAPAEPKAKRGRPPKSAKPPGEAPPPRRQCEPGCVCHADHDGDCQFAEGDEVGTRAQLAKWKAERDAQAVTDAGVNS